MDINPQHPIRRRSDASSPSTILSLLLAVSVLFILIAPPVHAQFPPWMGGVFHRGMQNPGAHQNPALLGSLARGDAWKRAQEQAAAESMAGYVLSKTVLPIGELVLGRPESADAMLKAGGTMAVAMPIMVVAGALAPELTTAVGGAATCLSLYSSACSIQGDVEEANRLMYVEQNPYEAKRVAQTAAHRGIFEGACDVAQTVPAKKGLDLARRLKYEPGRIELPGAAFYGRTPVKVLAAEQARETAGGVAINLSEYSRDPAVYVLWSRGKPLTPNGGGAWAYHTASHVGLVVPEGPPTEGIGAFKTFDWGIGASANCGTGHGFVRGKLAIRIPLNSWDEVSAVLRAAHTLERTKPLSCTVGVQRALAAGNVSTPWAVAPSTYVDRLLRTRRGAQVLMKPGCGIEREISYGALQELGLISAIGGAAWVADSIYP